MKAETATPGSELKNKAFFTITVLFAIVLFSCFLVFVVDDGPDVSGDGGPIMNSDASSTEISLVYSGAMITGMSDGDGYSLTGNTGTDAGDYVAIATLDDPINTTWPDGTTEPKSINWSISPKNLTNQMLAPFDNAVYSGNPISPTVFVTDENYSLVLDKDYTISYRENTNAGAAKAIITGIGNYTGTIEKSFNISLLVVEVPSQNNGLTYNGNEQIGIPEGERYAIVGDNNGINAGSYTTTISLTDPNNTLWDDGTTEDMTINWSINPRKITTSMVSQIENYEFSGNEAIPNIEVLISGEVLTLDVDYTISYSDNIYSGVAKVIITGIGNYSGTIEKTFSILCKDIVMPTINQELIYNGFEQSGIESGEGYTLTGDSSGLNAGTYSVTATLNDSVNTVWSDGTSEPKTLNWSIAKAKLTATYSGESIVFGTSPSLVITVEGFVSGEGPGTARGYSSPVLSNNQTNAGTYMMVPSGGSADNYEFEYIGGPLLISKKVIQIPVANRGLVYNGTEQIGVPEGDGYMLSGSIGTDAGSYRAMAALRDQSISSWPDGSDGHEEVTWYIAPKRLEQAMIDAPDQEYTGHPAEPVVVTDGGTLLVEGRDYVISYTDNVRVGSAAAAVTGTGNYTGTVPVAFDIAMRCAVSFSLNGSEGTAPGTQSVLGGTLLDLGSVTAPSRAGYGFCGWSTTPGGNAVSEFTVFSDATLYAAWALNVYDSMPEDEIADIISQNEAPVVQIRSISAGSALDSEFFGQLADTGKSFVLNVLGENGRVAYSWLFDGEYRPGAGTFVPGISESVPDFDLERLIESSDCENPLVLNFSASGVLPICAKVTYYLEGEYEDGTRLSVFFYDENAGLLREKQTATVTDGAVSFVISHCSRYVIAEETSSGTYGGNTGMYVAVAIVAIAFVDILAVYAFFVRRG
jgi:hypothetical protein